MSDEIEWNSSSLELADLSEQDRAKLRDQESRGLVSTFKQNKLEEEAAKNWDKFYKRNETKFYKDRHWTTREFQDLVSLAETEEQRTLLEIGCGVGNFLYPLLEAGLNWFVHACDFSPRAIDFVKSNKLYDEKKVHAFVHDITSDSLLASVPGGSVDIASLIFVLSAIAPDRHLAAVRSIRPCLKPGGAVILRDYGRYDVAQLRFRAGHKLGDNFYVRQDGTRAYYFTVEELSRLFVDAGFRVDSCQYVTRRTVNKKEGVDVRRTFVQGKFVRDDASAAVGDLCG